MSFRKAPMLAALTAVFLSLGTVALAAPPAQANYIVQLANGATAAEQTALQGQISALGGSTSRTYSHAFRGYLARLTANAAAALANSPRVVAVQLDHEIHALDVQSPTPSWGLDRIDQTGSQARLDSSFTYPTTPGAGVKIFVIDTGVQSDDPDFAGRTLPGVDYVGDGVSPNTDCNGHGTHVAGTAAGTEFGVAKSATIIPLRVLGCTGSGSFSGFAAAIDYVAGLNLNGARAVATASLGADNYIDTVSINAVNNLVSKGVVVTLAAGNGNTNACNSSPAAAADAITVGATTSTDARASYSNFGSCLDIFAPGSGITSDDAFIANGTQTWSGTSMATPHVAGAAATLLALNPTYTPAQVVSALQLNAQAGIVTSAGTGSPNYLLNTSFMVNGGVPPVTPVAPDAPTALTVGTVTSSSVALSWTAPTNTGTSPISSYRVEWKTSAATTWSGGSVASTSATVSGLASGTTYNFRVKAVSSAGTSVASNQVSATTTVSGTVPSAPRSLTSSAIYSNQLTLSWTAPSTNGGQAITGYKVQQLSGSTWNTIATVTTTSRVVTGLTASTSYSFRVLATNVIGDSVASNTVTPSTISATPGSVGTVSVSVGTSGRVSLKWSAVPVVTFGTAITYKVEILDSTGTNVLSTQTATTNSWNSTLTRAVTYKARVTALSGAVAGASSTSASFTTR